MENPIKKIDFTTLRGQKQTLLDVIAKLEEGCKDQLEIDDLTGILHLIDAIQDYAVDELGVPEMHVFDFEKEEERDGETPEEKFARVNAQIIFEMHIEGTALFDEETNGGMSREFIESIIDDSMHSSLIKNMMRLEILNDVTEHPSSFERDANGNLTYDANMYDYGFTIIQYCSDKFNEGKIKKLWLCPHCGSDNVETKNWVNANTGEVGTDCEDEQGYCKDCESHGELILSDVKYNAEVVGFQVVDDVEGDIHPDMDASFCLYSLSQAREMIRNSDDPTDCWKLLAIWTGDVEEPTIMFKGNPRD